MARKIAESAPEPQVAADTGAHAMHGAPIKYRPDIDGLRAVAVLSVIGFHAFPDWFPGGFVGVDVFFIISGYLISSIIFEQVRDGKFSIATFYARRIKRIFPSLIVILVFCLVAGWYVLLPHELKMLGKHVAAGAGFISNFALWRESGYFDVAAESKPLLHLWSLGIEEQFYFLWPATIYWAWKRKINLLGVVLVLVLASFALNIFFLHSKAVATFYLPATRVWELLIGGVLAHVDHGKNPSAALSWNRWSHARSLLGAGLILASVFLLNRYVAFPGWWALLPCIGAYLLISAGPKAWANQTILSRKVMVWFGLISFPLYLWHWPLLAFAQVIEAAKPAIEIRVVAVLASIALAWVTYQVVEKRVRFLPGAEKPLFAGCCVVLLLGLAAWQGSFEPRHHSPQIKAVADAIADWEYPPAGFSTLQYDGYRFDARRGAIAGSTIFLGDSDVQQYAPRADHLLASAPQTTRTAIFATTGGCPPIPGVVLDRTKDCQPRLAAASKLALTSDVDVIVIGACWYCYFYSDAKSTSPDEYYFLKNGQRYYLNTPAGVDLAIASFEAFLKSMSSRKKVYVVLSSPVGDDLDPRYLLTGSRFGTLAYKQQAGLSQAGFLARFGAMNERLRHIASGAGAIIIDPLPAMCANGVCPALADDGMPIYSDGVHIRASYVRKFASFVDPALKLER